MLVILVEPLSHTGKVQGDRNFSEAGLKCCRCLTSDPEDSVKIRRVLMSICKRHLRLSHSAKTIDCVRSKIRPWASRVEMRFQPCEGLATAIEVSTWEEGQPYARKCSGLASHMYL